MTRIDYPDIHASSPSGSYHLEIVSPDNALENPRPPSSASPSRRVWGGYQSDFTIRLNDVAGSVVWVLKRDLHAHEAWVDDDGWVVLRTHHVFHAGLVVLSSTAEQILDLDLLDGVFSQSDKRRVHETSAGPFWATASVGYFITVDGRRLWCIRTWWGRRIIIDLAEHSLIDERDVDLTPFEAGERKLVLSNLQHCSARWRQSTTRLPVLGRTSFFRPTLGAAYLAGKMKLHEGVPFLRQLEGVTYTGGYPVRRGLIPVTLPLRQVAQLSLRRLGIEPAGRSTYDFYKNLSAVNDPLEHPLPLPIRSTTPSPNDITAGLSQLEVLHDLGSPDYIQRSSWDYDWLTPQPQSLRIHWTAEDGHESVSSVEIVDPPDWLANEQRETHMIF